MCAVKKAAGQELQQPVSVLASLTECFEVKPSHARTHLKWIAGIVVDGTSIGRCLYGIVVKILEVWSEFH